jgi:hypothetical protein
VPSQDDRNTLIERLAALPAMLRTALAGAGEEELDTTYRDGGWTIRQVVHHLADSHMNAYIRARLILTEENPTLRPYAQDEWARLADAASGPLAPSLAILEGIHARWVALLRAIDESAWARPATHPEYGATSIEGLLQTYTAHGDNHLEHIRLGRARFARR